RGHIPRRHGQPVFFHRYRGGVARERNRRGGHLEGNEGGWHLRLRSKEKLRREAFPATHLPGSFAKTAQGDGLDRLLNVLGQQNAHSRVRSFQTAQSATGSDGGEGGDVGDGVRWKNTQLPRQYG